MGSSKLRIFYFSPTGGGAAVANAVAKDGGELFDFTLPENRKIPPQICSADENLFVFPVYNRGVPEICAQYVRNLKGNGSFADVICIYGGVTKGKCLPQAAKLLSDCGFVPRKGACVPAPHCYCKRQINALTPERLDLIRDFMKGKVHLSPISSEKKCADLSVQRAMKRVTGRCIVDHSLCNGCGKCREVCPSGAADATSTDDALCILCGACVKKCPQGARRIKFYTPFPSLFVNANCKERKDEFFCFSDGGTR